MKIKIQTRDGTTTTLEPFEITKEKLDEMIIYALKKKTFIIFETPHEDLFVNPLEICTIILEKKNESPSL